MNRTIVKALTLHEEFFSARDSVQTRYETVRLRKHGKATAAEAAAHLGFHSRSSYYTFARQMREQGFAGLFDLRPWRRKKPSAEPGSPPRAKPPCSVPESRRPAASIWIPSCEPWHNAFYGLHRDHHDVFVRIVRAFAEGNGVRGISRIFDVDKNTVLNYLQRNGHQCRRVTDWFLRDMHIEEIQLDEMWSFVCKKEKHLTEEEYATGLKGDQWCWGAFDPRTKVLVAYEIGRRTYTLARDLIRNLQGRTDGVLPSLITSDNYPGYAAALLDVYGIPTPDGKVAPPEMDYAVVSKTREKGRVVDIQVEIVFGILDRILEKLAASPVSNAVNTSFIERSHLSRRQFNRRLTRKTPGFSKKVENHRWHYESETTIHNFVRPHRSLGYRTPMMAAGKTDHVWTTEELLSFTAE